MIRKNTRFRIYIACLSLLYGLGLFFLVSRLRASSARNLAEVRADFESRIASIERASIERASSVSPSVVSESSSAASSSSSSDDYKGPSYFIRASGRSGKWGYIDVLFLDGFRARYYYRLSPDYALYDLRRLVQRLEQDSFLHEWGVGFSWGQSSSERRDE